MWKRKITRTVKLVALVMALCMSMTFVCSAAYVTDGTNYYLFGDATNDKQVDVKDLVRVKRHLADDSVTITEVAGDMNGNSEVDSGDIPLLQKQLIGVDEVEDGGKYWSPSY